MPTITLSVSPELKNQLELNKMINWSEVARRAFVQQLKDLIELGAIKRARDISGLQEDEKREFNLKYIKELEKISKGSHSKSISMNELNKLMGI